jgi:hypothetical protein
MRSIFLNTFVEIQTELWKRKIFNYFAIHDICCILNIRLNVQQAFDIVTKQNSGTQNSMNGSSQMQKGKNWISLKINAKRFF